ncbi:MAG TPA: fibronectin type III domain-containing protein, partial [Acidobacteriaceae bacterium]|nr:fibronectin type III domain-containing protein [Acidobacteriaceae bacterium]
QRVEKITMQGEPVAVAGPASKPMRIDARDLFPPATPTGLQAVADPEAHAIDLSWQPGTEADLAGYRVYRREAGTSAQPQRVSGAVEAAPSFHDAGAQPGHTYWYSVSAVDKDSNESPRSAEVEESLAQQ